MIERRGGGGGGGGGPGPKSRTVLQVFLDVISLLSMPSGRKDCGDQMSRTPCGM